MTPEILANRIPFLDRSRPPAFECAPRGRNDAVEPLLAAGGDVRDHYSVAGLMTLSARLVVTISPSIRLA